MIYSRLSQYFNQDAKELLLKSTTYLIIRILGTFFTFGFSYYIINTYSSSIYGLISLGFSFFLIIGVIGRLGLDLNIVKLFSLNSYRNNAGLFYKSLIIVFLATSLIAVFVFYSRYFIVNNIFEHPKPELIPYLEWILYSIPFWSVTLLNAHLLRARKMNNWFVFFNNPGRFVFTLGVLLILQHAYVDNAILVVKSYLVAIILLSLLSTYLAFLCFKRITLTSETELSGFVKESLPNMYSSTTNMLINWVGIFILGIYATSQDIAVFEIGVKVSLLLTFISHALSSILAPKISKCYHEGDLDTFQQLVTLSTSINFISSFLLSIIILVFHKFILGIFGSEFNDSILLIFLLCLAQLVSSFCGYVGVILQMTGYQKLYKNLMLISLLILMISMFILVPLYKGEGAAMSMLLSMMFWNIFGAIYIKRKLNIICYFSLNRVYSKIILRK